jgi:UDPglucose 6-dehydrogenase/UDP-N-acetyl-D-galactosamine dehydrogenase
MGLGYIGRPLVEAFSRKFTIIGFDIDSDLVKRLDEVNFTQNITVTNDPSQISQALVIIICVPTPVTGSREPDLTAVKTAAEIAGKYMQEGSLVILESTVYPGATEEIVIPILEETSGFKSGVDFKIAYCPERINPGDEKHSIDKITKVVAGLDEETTKIVAELYGEISRRVFKAKDIKTAEAAKVIENVQRDLNIALVNELSIIFAKMGLDTKDVLDTASTKWNFHNYSPGLVGGHCIPVDPYYLVYKAKEIGYKPKVILAGRAVNSYIPKYIVDITLEAIKDVGKKVKGSKVLIMGLTYKENVADTRETPVKDIIKELKRKALEVYGHDPLLSNIENEFGIGALSNFEDVSEVDGLILTVRHDSYEEITLEKLSKIMSEKPVLIDVPGLFNKNEAVGRGFYYRTL